MCCLYLTHTLDLLANNRIKTVRALVPSVLDSEGIFLSSPDELAKEVRNMWQIEEPLENRDGVLCFDNHSTIELAAEYGTPLYVYSKARIIENYRRMSGAFSKRYRKFKLHYAVKANSNLAILKILRRVGAGADCASPAEIFLALEAGFKPGDILYTGNYNSDEELEYACKQQVKVNLDDISLVDRVVTLSKERKTTLPPIICFRLDPGTGKGKFDGLITSGPEAKFGMDEGRITEAYAKARDYGFRRFGIHMMSGSCILEEKHFEKVADKLFETVRAIVENVGIKFEFIDLGGGFGISYEPGEKDLDVERLADRIVERFKERIKKYNLGRPYLYIEPGRYIVGDAGIMLTRVNCVKNAQKVFVGVDAGRNALIRPALYGAYHQIYLANELDRKVDRKVDIVGQICENTDHLARNRLMPKIERNDVLAVLNAGAYCFSMSSQYNGRPRPAEVLLGSKVEVVRRRETFRGLLRGQRLK